MTKKHKTREKKEEIPSTVPDEPIDDADADAEDEDLPVRIGVYSQHELAFGDIMRAIFGTLTGAYQGGMTRKEFRKASGVKKKTLRRIESMDLTTPIGDVLRVLAAANKTLAIVPLNGMSAEAAAKDALSELEDVLTSTSDLMLEEPFEDTPVEETTMEESRT